MGGGSNCPPPPTTPWFFNDPPGKGLKECESENVIWEGRDGS